MTESETAPEDDLFWLQRAGSIVTGTAETMDAAARRIADAMAWFWTAYAAVSLAVVSFQPDVVNGIIAVITIALPAVLIFAAYLVATFATLPIEIKFNDQVPESIKAAHDQAIKRKKKRIWLATVLASLAACGVAVAVSVVALERTAGPSDHAAVFEVDQYSRQALIGGRLDGTDHVIVSVTDPSGQTTRRVVPVVKNSWNTTIDLATRGTYEAKAAWVLNQVQYSIEKELKMP